MEPLIHVYYDQVNNQMVLFEVTIDSRYIFIYEDKELNMNFKDLDSVKDKEFFIYLGAVN